MVEREWPELLKFPGNRWWGWRKVTKSLAYIDRPLRNGHLSHLVNRLRVRVALRTRIRRWLQK